MKGFVCRTLTSTSKSPCGDFEGSPLYKQRGDKRCRVVFRNRCGYIVIYGYGFAVFDSDFTTSVHCGRSEILGGDPKSTNYEFEIC